MGLEKAGLGSTCLLFTRGHSCQSRLSRPADLGRLIPASRPSKPETAPGDAPTELTGQLTPHGKHCPHAYTR